MNPQKRVYPQINTNGHRLKCGIQIRGKLVFPSLFLFLPLCLCAFSVAGGSIIPSDTPTETYRLKVENALYGRIEISTDGGKRFRTIGRVTEPATETQSEKGTNERGTVWKSGKDGLTFLVSPGKAVKLVPQRESKGSKKGKGKRLPGLSSVEPSAIRTNLSSGTGIFGEWAPSTGTPVTLLGTRGQTEAFYDLYKPRTGDVFSFRVSLANEKGEVTSGEKIAEKVTKLEETYNAGAIVRAKSNKRRIISGVLTLRATLPANEPDPIQFVTFLVDGDEVSTSNAAPFAHEWNTKATSDGEHIVEVKAFNKDYRLLTQTRILLVVQNGKG